MNRNIRKVAVLGSGVMGSQIACHFANIGCEVLLLDIVPKELDEKSKKKGLSLEDQEVRNSIVNHALQSALKMNPSPIYKKSFADNIATGNMEDDMEKIKDCDWIIEVVIERLDIKKQVFENVEKYRKEGTLITSNTSGIPINTMLEGRSDDFQKHFCGTHFFNPPRYLQLLEIIPTEKTDDKIIDFLMDYGRRFLGKKTVRAKDTPAFIGNRIGVYSIMSLFHTVKDMGLTIEEVDKLTGTILGRPKSATFRTADVVGLDTLVHVANGLQENCPDDEANELFKLPDYLQKMIDNEMLGSKTKKGFYKKIKDDEGKSQILSLDLDSMEYSEQKKVKFDTIGNAKQVENLEERYKTLIAGKDKAGEFYRKTFFGLFQYVSNRIPEISDEIYKIDDGLRAGFGWQLGPFESWDAMGVKKTVEKMEEAGIKPAQWVYDMLDAGHDRFYITEDGDKKYYDIDSKSYKTIPGTEQLVMLEALRENNTVWSSQDATIVELGDGIINFEFHTKMNTIGGGVLSGLNKAIDMAEKEYKGLVISNRGDNFSVGANVGMIFMMAAEQEYDELDMAVRQFQDTMMRVRYSSIPVVVAPHNMALGGGCEMSMHADKVVAHAELYMGLVEFGVGLIPGGGGTKEFALRLSDEIQEGDVRINRLRKRFLTIGQAEVATSAYEAFDKGYLREGKDEVVVSREYQLTFAKDACLQMAERGYTKPVERNDVKVLGNEGMGIVYVGADSMNSANYISDHDKIISEELGTVLCGGELSEITKVSERYLLDMERKAFIKLCSERKTLERLQSMAQKGKVLRN